MVAYLKASTNEKTNSDYLWAAREAEKEEVMEPSHSQTADSTSKPKVMSFFLLQKLKCTQVARTLLYRWHTWRKRVQTKKKALRVKTPVALKA